MEIGQSTNLRQGQAATEHAQTVLTVCVGTPSLTIGKSAILVSFMLAAIVTPLLVFLLSCTKTQLAHLNCCADSFQSTEAGTFPTISMTKAGTLRSHHACGATRTPLRVRRASSRQFS